jgi:hypothetical protein
MKFSSRSFPLAMMGVLLFVCFAAQAAAPIFIQPDWQTWLQFEGNYQNRLKTSEVYATAGSPQFVDGYLGQGCKFTGDARVLIPYPQRDRRAGTIRFWFRPDWDAPDGEKSLLERGGQADLWVAADGRLSLKFFNNNPENSKSGFTITSAAPIAWEAGKWFFIQATWAFNEGATLSVDGNVVAATSQRAVASLWADATGWRVGNNRDGTAPADGTIDELQIMTRPNRDFNLNPVTVNSESGVTNKVYRLDGGDLAQAAGEGTVVGTPNLVEGKFSQAVEFTGGACIEYSYPILDKRSGSIELWLKPNWNAWELDQEKYIAFFDNEMNLSVTADGKLRLHLYNNVPEDKTGLDLFSEQALPWVAGQWHHIQATWGKDRGAALFFDGQEVARTKTYAVAKVWAGTLSVGNNDDYNSAIDGVIDDLVLRFAADNRDFQQSIVGYQLKQLQKPEGLAPAADAICQELPTFTWNAVADAVSYILQYSKFQDFRADEDTRIQQEVVGNSFTVTDEKALLPGRWYWRVLAVATYGQSQWSQPESVIVSQSPAGYIVQEEAFDGDRSIGCATWDNTIKASVEFVTEPRRQGEGALRWNYDFTNATGFYTEISLKRRIPGKAKWIGLWVYVPEDEAGRALTYRIHDLKGNTAQKGVTPSQAGWNYLELLVDIPRTYGGDGQMSYPRDLWTILVEYSGMKKRGYVVVDDLTFIARRGEPASLEMELSAEKLPADGVSTATITVHATDAGGNPVPDGTLINFSATAGVLSSAAVETQNGVAQTTIQAAALDDDDVTVRAESGWAVAEKKMAMGQLTNWAWGGFSNQLTVSSENPSYPKEALTDGMNTMGVWGTGRFWAAQDKSAPQWAVVEFPSPRLLRRIKVFMYWERKHIAKDYEVQIHDGTNWVSVGKLTGNGNAINTFDFSPVYTQRVRLWITGLNTEAAKVVEFEAWGPANQSPIGTPKALAPADEQLLSSSMPAFSWEAVPAAQGYVLQYCPDGLFANGLVEISVAGASFTPETPLPNGQLYWRVAATGASGLAGVFSPVRSFTVSQAEQVAPPELLTPEKDGVLIDRRPVFTWNAVAGASGYVLEYTAGDSFYDVSTQRETVSGLEYTPAEDLTLGVTYAWRLRALDADGNAITAFSAARKFKIYAADPAAAFSVLAYTNPFPLRQGQARIGYVIGADNTKLSIRIYNMAGRLVKTIVAGELRSAGYHQEYWNGKDEQGRYALSGPYVIKGVAEDASGRKITLRKVIIVLK